MRLSRPDTTGLEILDASLTTVVGRVCLNMLRAHQSRREDPLDGHRNVSLASGDDGIGPEHDAIRADSVVLAISGGEIVEIDLITAPEQIREFDLVMLDD